MLYTSTTIDEVIGRIIRNTRVQDSSFLSDIGEWIPEAMGMMKTYNQPSHYWKDVDVEFYRACTPCNTIEIDAVSYKCRRLVYSTGVRPGGSSQYCASENTNMIYISDPATTRSVLGGSGTITQYDYEWIIPTDNTETNYYFLKFGIAGQPTIAGILVNFDTTSPTTIANSVTELSNALNALNLGVYTVDFNNNDEIIIVSLSNPYNLDWILVQTTAAPVGISYNASVVTTTTPVSGSSIVDTAKPFIPSIQIDIKSVLQAPQSEYTYFVEMGHINTPQIKDGIIRVFYRAMPHDANGFPLIPDNEEYKQALYWYCRGQMIGAGWKDTVFTWSACKDNFDIHAQRAINQIRFPSPEKTESTLRNHSRLVIPDNYFETFFDNMGKEKPYL